MRFISNKRLYLPAFTLIAVVLLLILMIAISTYRNLSHQRRTALAFLNSQGVTLVHSLEAAAKTGLIMPMWGDDAVKTLISEFGKNRNLEYIYIFGQDGVITHASPVSLVGSLAPWHPELEKADNVISRLSEKDSGSQVYELAKRFSPLPVMPHHQGRHMPMYGTDGLLLKDHTGNTVVLGLSMKEFEAAHNSDLQHAMIMGATLLVLGSGAFFFAFVVQNYYLVDRALDKSRDYLKLVMASMSNGMLSIDAKGKIVTINHNAENLLGITEQEIKPLDLRAFIDFTSTGIDKTLADGTPVVEKEIVCERPSGPVPLSLSASPIIDEDKKSSFTGAVVILRDLTEIKRLQERVRRSEKLASIGELATGIAHEVRNPLSSIRGFAQFLKRVLKDQPKEREYAELMVKEVDRINNVVTNLLSFARPVHSEPQSTNIPELFQHAIRLVQEDSNLRKVAIHLDVPEDENLYSVMVDGSQMTQVILNLVLNALQAVDVGGHIWIAARKSDALELCVEDDGPGIPADKVKRIFDPFFTTKEKGTGLGMAIVQMIVENHGGDIRVISPVPGKTHGCRIELRLPAFAAAQESDTA